MATALTFRDSVNVFMTSTLPQIAQSPMTKIASIIALAVLAGYSYKQRHSNAYALMDKVEKRKNYTLEANKLERNVYIWDTVLMASLIANTALFMKLIQK